jgi:hypothetical protein
LGVAACNRSTPTQVGLKQEEPASTPNSLPSQVTAAATPESPSPSATADTRNTTAGFQKPAANEAWNQYIEEFQAIKSLPPPQIQDPVNNPAQVTGYLNQLGSQLKALQESRQAVEANLASPEEKKRFRAAEKSLIDGQDQ